MNISMNMPITNFNANENVKKDVNKHVSWMSSNMSMNMLIRMSINMSMKMSMTMLITIDDDHDGHDDAVFLAGCGSFEASSLTCCFPTSWG